MTSPDKAQLAANEGFKKYLVSDEFIAVTTGNTAITAKAVLFNTNSSNAVASAAAAYISNAGFSQEKLTAKETLSFTVAYMSGNAQVKLDEISKQSISMQLHDAETYYLKAADAECAVADVVFHPHAAHGFHRGFESQHAFIKGAGAFDVCNRRAGECNFEDFHVVTAANC